MKRTSFSFLFFFFDDSSRRSCRSSYNWLISPCSALVVGAYLEYSDAEWIALDTNQDHYIIIDIKTNTKPHQKARKLQYRMPYTKPLAKEQHNVTNEQKVCIKPCQSHRPPKHITVQHNDLQRDKIQIHPPEHRHKSPQPGNLHKALAQPHT